MASKLLLATNNPGKIREYKVLLAALPLVTATLAEVGIETEPEETGSTFEENALIKARYYWGLSSILTLADDSGLEVDALGGEPGVHSSRYAGDGATDEDRVKLLLTRMKDVPWSQRTARFRCVVALVWPSGQEETFHGSQEGYIPTRPAGGNGFGYDPVFFFPALGKTFAELQPEEKNRLSHRAKAARKAAERLRTWVKATSVAS